MQKNLSSGRIHWLDFARVLACFVVVLAHSCDFYVAAMETSPVDFFSGSAWGTLTRACVPLFVMFSGVLLLPTEQPVLLLPFFSPSFIIFTGCFLWIRRFVTSLLSRSDSIWPLFLCGIFICWWGYICLSPLSRRGFARHPKKIWNCF